MGSHKLPPLDFAAISDAALRSAESLLGRWLPDGVLRGAEWVARNPRRNDRNVGSFSVNVHTGAWADFASGDKGGDLISLYAYLFGVSNGDAARALAETLRMDVPAPAVTGVKKTRTEWVAQPCAPADAPEPPKAHIKRGLPERVWRYAGPDGETLGYVYRFRTSDGGKEILPLVWATHPERPAEWRWMAFPEPRPLYGLDRLAAMPDAPAVLLLEGEKCADAAQGELSGWPCMSWSGGGNADGKTDWSPLQGRKVLLWPDADSHRVRPKNGEDPDSMPLLPASEQPGLKAMRRIAGKLLALRCDVWLLELPEPGTLADGWDVADAIADGWDAQRIYDYLRAHLRRYTPGGAGARAGEDTPQAQAEPGGGGDWRGMLIRGDSGAPKPLLFNAHLALAEHEVWAGVLAYDQFNRSVCKLKPPPYHGGEPGLWRDVDTTQTIMWLQNREGILMSRPGDVEAAVKAAAQIRTFHPVRDWLEGLPPWDGIERLPHIFADVLGATEIYAPFFGQAMLVAAIRRVMEPGCQVDEMIVLEGDQGFGKSRFVRTLFAPEWYLETADSPAGKDFYIGLEGKWGVEIGEMNAFRKASDWTQVKLAISRRDDHYRAPYDRNSESHPRQCIFVGTTNEDEWIADPTGGRRFIPIRVRQQVDVDWVERWRAQLWAEALSLFRADFRYWDYPKEWVTEEQENRQIHDPWLGPILKYLDGQADSSRYQHRCADMRPFHRVAIDELLIHALGFEVCRIQKHDQMRVGGVMRALRWQKKRASGEGGVRPWVYERPESDGSERK